MHCLGHERTQRALSCSGRARSPSELSRRPTLVGLLLLYHPSVLRLPNTKLCPCSPAAANERTFLSWMGMAVTLGTIGTAIAGFAVTEDETGATKGIISQGTIELMTMLMLPLSIAIIGYAMYTFYMRSEFIRKKQVSICGGTGPSGLVWGLWCTCACLGECTTRFHASASLPPSPHPFPARYEHADWIF